MNALTRNVILDQIEEAMNVTDGNVRKAAQLLGVSYTTVYRHLHHKEEKENVIPALPANAVVVQDVPSIRLYAAESVTQELLESEAAAGRTRLIVLIKHKEDSE